MDDEMEYDEVWSFPYDQIEAYLIECGESQAISASRRQESE